MELIRTKIAKDNREAVQKGKGGEPFNKERDLVFTLGYF
jgi:hypothetical protein